MKIGIFGFGAVGNAIYNELHEYKDLYVLLDDSRYNRYINQEFKINGNIINPKFITEGLMDVIFICLKNYDLDSSLGYVKPFIGKKTILIPMLNGITAHDVIKEYYPFNRVLYGVINVESNKNGNETICGKILNLQFGDEYNYPVKKELMDIRRLLLQYNMHANIYPDMKRRVWHKWMLNMGINQVSAVLNATYREMASPYMRDLFKNIYYEVYEVANAYNVRLEETDIEHMLAYFSGKGSDRVTSLTLDIQNHRRSEIEYFGGTLVRLAKEKNISVPYNEALYAMLKLLDDRK